ncbi:adenosylcobinamide-phosphate synthase CbiB [Hydrogenimonas thermophila]|uniref:Cobalamin biosynthesis protein CobD n=1 Tax=Hydrogenimonas thermophila TaxID=223786 RepID=A0A1I5MVL1_9BACT|nr:adenosylcobinamide-phosphate synthase CbiB [Hydrogenimonas thermophila]SFP13572.1 adenosylcobinamide-phosphate synthase [Hydrogenimonas thermophila]
MVYLEIALIAYVIDLIFGEFKITHPVVLMGNYIKWFESKFYKDSVFAGAALGVSLVLIVGVVSYILENILLSLGSFGVLAAAGLGSMAIANNMLYESVKRVINHPEEIRFLVSRDTDNLTQSEINRAAIETYAENLSDGVIAPLFYLAVFGLTGAFVYKAINTLDSMVGYQNSRYANFGKFSAKLDDVANLLPSRITAILISLLFMSKRAILKLWKFGKLHKSPNAGYPISAIALALGIKLGGATSYFGQIVNKPYFGDGREEIKREDIYRALKIKKRLDIFIIVTLSLGVLFC